MSETITRVAAGDFGRPFGAEVLPPAAGDAGVPDLVGGRRPAPGSAVDDALSQIVVAQHTPVKRDLARILREINVAAELADTDWYYEWETKNRDGSRGVVRGPSIKCAMAIAHIWGNCRVEAFPTFETQSHWTFLARFTDYEKGVSVTRAFQQRKAQTSGGRMDAERMQDIAFQIGQSKATRNVVVAALGMYVDRAVDAARLSMFGRVEKNPAGAKAHILKMARDCSITNLGRLTRAVGRAEKDWTTEDMVLLLGRLRAIDDGMETADEAFPEPADDPAPAAPPTSQPERTTGVRGTARGSGRASTPSQPTQQAAAQQEPQPQEGRSPHPDQNAGPPSQKADDGNIPLEF